MLSLGRWLGPWAGESTPKNTVREETVLDVGRPMRVAVHRPRQKEKGVWLVTPGLHPAGPDDPRLDRFCRVLAASGCASSRIGAVRRLLRFHGDRSLRDFGKRRSAQRARRSSPSLAVLPGRGRSRDDREGVARDGRPNVGQERIEGGPRARAARARHRSRAGLRGRDARSRAD